MTRKTTFATAAAVLAALLLSGCTSTIAPDPTATPPNEPVLVDVPESTEAGGALTEEQAREVNTDASDGLIGYKLSDGSYVLIRENEPLPANVVADVKAKAAAAVPAVSESALSGSENADAVNSGDRIANQLEREVGKNVLLVYSLYTYEGDESPSTAGFRWKIRNSVNLSYPTISGETLEQAVARAEGYIAGFENPSDWVVIAIP